jgi:hypothetical protein
LESDFAASRLALVRCSAEYTGVWLLPECNTAKASKQISCVRDFNLTLLTMASTPAANCAGY